MKQSYVPLGKTTLIQELPQLRDEHESWNSARSQDTRPGAQEQCKGIQRI